MEFLQLTRLGAEYWGLEYRTKLTQPQSLQSLYFAGNSRHFIMGVSHGLKCVPQKDTKS